MNSNNYSPAIHISSPAFLRTVITALYPNEAKFSEKGYEVIFDSLYDANMNCGTTQILDPYTIANRFYEDTLERFIDDYKCGSESTQEIINTFLDEDGEIEWETVREWVDSNRLNVFIHGTHNKNMLVWEVYE